MPPNFLKQTVARDRNESEAAVFEPWTPRLIDSLVRLIALDPNQLKLVLDGIALARATRAPEG